MSRGDGFELDILGKKIVVGYNPHRKSPCLSIVTHGGCVINTLAYFRSEDDALLFIEHLTGEVKEFKDPDGH